MCHVTTQIKIPYPRASDNCPRDLGRKFFLRFPENEQSDEKRFNNTRRNVSLRFSRNDLMIFLFIPFYDPPVVLAQHELHRNLRSSHFLRFFHCAFFLLLPAEAISNLAKDDFRRSLGRISHRGTKESEVFRLIQIFVDYCAPQRLSKAKNLDAMFSQPT